MKLSNLIADDKDLGRMSNSKVIILACAAALIFGFLWSLIAYKTVDNTLAGILAAMATGTKITPQIMRAIKEIFLSKEKKSV